MTVTSSWARGIVVAVAQQPNHDLPAKVLSDVSCLIQQICDSACPLGVHATVYLQQPMNLAIPPGCRCLVTKVLLTPPPPSLPSPPSSPPPPSPSPPPSPPPPMSPGETQPNRKHHKHVKTPHVKHDHIKTNDKKISGFRKFKIGAIQTCPYPETLYIDNDIYMMDAHAVLTWFDQMNSTAFVGARSNPAGSAGGTDGEDADIVPADFMMVNAGVLFLRCPAAQGLLDRWAELYESRTNPNGKDQRSFRAALYPHREHLQMLPRKFNCRPSHADNTTEHARTEYAKDCVLRHFHGQCNSSISSGDSV
mmetsp:Transcript_9230/g.19960  ORF Transcript_9230/g.19960 Transcript_9230/m.19960 type:complete len:307 (-) Transcript_9230:177-1097(-)